MSLLKQYIIADNKTDEIEYNELLFAGTDDRNIQIAYNKLKTFFPDVPIEESISLLKSNKIFLSLINMVQNAFIKWYHWNPGDIIVNQKNQNSIISYAVTDLNFPMFIHIGTLLEVTTLSFMMVMLQWAKANENSKSEKSYFNKLLYIINEMALMGLLPDEAGQASIINDIINDYQLQNLSADCHWAMLLFTAGHEMAHIYQMSTNPDYWINHRQEAEKNADYIGYDILLHLIMEPLNPDFIIEEYTYLAPMMYMDMFELIFYTDEVLYENHSNFGYHGTPDERKQALFSQVDQEIYQFDTTLGNSVYQSFLNTYDKYCESLLYYKNNNKLNHITHYNERKEHKHI